jgi:hypothetical protein
MMSGRPLALMAKDPTATLRELEEAERELRETAERQITNMEEEAYFITLADYDIDGDDPSEAIDGAVDEIIQLAENIESDAIDWGECFKALIRARAKAKVA